MADGGKTTLEVGPDGVAVITIVNPPVNSLSLDVLKGLKYNYDLALKRNDVRAIVITGSSGKFSGGFDISAFGAFQREDAIPEHGNMSGEAFNAVEGAQKPSVAAIDGLALGGGLELAMVCHARIATPTSQFGLPELQLGLIPGFGGTQRLPRLVGISKALDMMLTSKSVKGDEAHALGLVDAIVSANELVSIARQWALDIVECKKPWTLSLYKNDKLDSLEDARDIFKFARAEVRKRAPNLTHPIVCINVVEEGIVSGPVAGLLKEARDFWELVQSDVCKCLVHVFFSLRGTTKVPGVTDVGLRPRRCNKVAVLGGGLMGSGIATAWILGNYHVILKELNRDLVKAGIGRIRVNLQNRVDKGKMTEEKFERTFSLLRGVVDYESFRDVDLVIEAVVENTSLKQKIFADLEKYCPPHCILATNTSTIDLNLIGEKIRSKERIVGAHFFSPAHVMPLLEVIRTEHTAPQVIVDLLDIGKRIRKTPVVVRNCTGFAVNRMNLNYIMSAIMLAERGTDLYLIDKALTKFGMPIGPFRVCDLVGFGVLIASGMHFLENLSGQMYKSFLIPLMHEDKRSGQVTGKGFYAYENRRRARPDNEVRKYIEKARNISGINVDPKFLKLSEKDIVEMVLFPLVNEACRVYSEGVVVKSADLDVLSIMGMGFPPYRGGVLFWADFIGPKYMHSKLEQWSNDYGEFLKPCPFLSERALAGVPLANKIEQTKSRM